MLIPAAVINVLVDSIGSEPPAPFAASARVAAIPTRSPSPTCLRSMHARHARPVDHMDTATICRSGRLTGTSWIVSPLGDDTHHSQGCAGVQVQPSTGGRASHFRIGKRVWSQLSLVCRRVGNSDYALWGGFVSSILPLPTALLCGDTACRG